MITKPSSLKFSQVKQTQNLPENTVVPPRMKGLTTCILLQEVFPHELCRYLSQPENLENKLFCSILFLVVLISEVEEKQNADMRMNNGRQ